MFKDVIPMKYRLCPDVYLVKGKENGCLYDFNHKKLYSVNKELKIILNEINRGIFHPNLENLENISILRQLERVELITKTDEPHYQSIQEIGEKGNRCDFAWIEITSRCNLKCKHCYNESSVEASSEMSFSDYEKALNALIRLGVKKVQIIGGEPFFDSVKLKRILDYTIGKMDMIEVFTNGTLITDPWFDYLAKNKIRMALSVYSYREDMHDRVTQCKGAWKRTQQTIEKLKQHHIRYRVCNVLMKGIELGEKRLQPYTLHQDRDVVRMSGRANFNLLSDELIRKRLITKETFTYPLDINFSRRMINGHNCFANRVYIAANLKVYPCVMERRICHCDLTNDKEIHLNNTILSFNKDKVQGCSLCEYRYCCFDCRPNSLSGSFIEQPWYCTYEPETGTWKDVESVIKELHTKWDKG